jgi:undecaprenyl phosphate N,N'-diacetylbacillosamine 1-phosphate transferase
MSGKNRNTLKWDPERSSLNSPLFNPGWLAIKRMIDLIFSILLLAAFIPVICIILILVVLDSSGNPIFLQHRVGKDGKLFTIFKIRTLYLHHFGIIPEEIQPAAHRITRIGKHLRRYKLDELPQLVNILLGDMSFIGPRPFIPFEFEFDNYLKYNRVLVKPGLTGAAQISSSLSVAKVDIGWMDLWYIKNWSLLADLKIVIFTAVAIFKQENDLYDPLNLEKYLPTYNPLMQ